MTDADDDHDETGPPPPFFVYYNPIVHILKLVAILAICAVLILVPFWVGNVDSDAGRLLGAIVIVFLIWGYITGRRIRDRRPQVVLMSLPDAATTLCSEYFPVIVTSDLFTIKPGETGLPVTFWQSVQWQRN